MDDEAQRWLGWTDEQRQLDTRTSPDHIDLLRTMIGTASYSRMTFTGYETVSGRMVGSLSLYWNGTAFEIGGTVVREARNLGYGTKLMDAACHIAHRHFGLIDVHAGCEPTNTASIRWLAKSGFQQIPGPDRHTLPDGRVVDAIRWVNSDPTSRRECAYATPEPSQWKRYPSEIWADLPLQRSAD